MEKYYVLTIARQFPDHYEDQVEIHISGDSRLSSIMKLVDGYKLVSEDHGTALSARVVGIRERMFF